MLDAQERVDSIRELIVQPVLDCDDMRRIDRIHDDDKPKVYFEPMWFDMMFELLPLFFDVKVLSDLDERVRDPPK